MSSRSPPISSSSSPPRPSGKSTVPVRETWVSAPRAFSANGTRFASLRKSASVPLTTSTVTGVSSSVPSMSARRRPPAGTSTTACCKTICATGLLRAPRTVTFPPVKRAVNDERCKSSCNVLPCARTATCSASARPWTGSATLRARSNAPTSTTLAERSSVACGTSPVGSKATVPSSGVPANRAAIGDGARRPSRTRAASFTSSRSIRWSATRLPSKRMSASDRSMRAGSTDASPALPSIASCGTSINAALTAIFVNGLMAPVL